MTREEAIHFAECLKNNWTINFADMEDFCDMAIEALMHDRRNMNKTDAAEILQKYVFDDEECIAQDMKDYNEALKMAIEALKADAEKKKAELKENGDWDCPDVYCDECDHHRSVEWCSLAIPNHEEIDETYKMVNEAFFEGFDAAEQRYRFLIETVEELMESAELSGDLISRKKAKEEIYLLGCNPSIAVIWDCLDALPSTDRPHGEWVDKGGYSECSECGEVAQKVELCDCVYERLTNFCPNCGAEMNEGK